MEKLANQGQLTLPTSSLTSLTQLYLIAEELLVCDECLIISHRKYWNQRAWFVEDYNHLVLKSALI